jgi:hypothetical protein
MNFFVLKELEKFKDIKFDEESHSYSVNGIPLLSVTKLVGTTTFFDTKRLAAQKAESLGIPVRDVLLNWQRKGDYARIKGHEMHSYIEYLWQGKKYNWKPQDKYFEMIVELDCLKEQYGNFYKPASKLMSLIAAENVVYDIDYKVAGTFDGLFHNKVNDRVDIWDWKTSKEIKKTNPYGHKLIGLDHLDECNFNEYALQLSLYKYIIERNTDIKIGTLNICQISMKNKNYNAFKVPYLKDEVVYLLRKNLLHK